MNSSKNRAADAESVGKHRVPPVVWTWITTIGSYIFVGFCVYVVIALYTLGWIQNGWRWLLPI